MVQSIGETTMDDQDIMERRRTRRRRIERVTKRSGGGSRYGVLGSPVAAVFCMVIALGSIVAFWGGLPGWALLAMGFGAVLIMIVATLLWRARHKAPPEAADAE